MSLRTVYQYLLCLVFVLNVFGERFKPYSGVRVSANSKRIVYQSEQTIAVVELAAKRILLNCELIEVVEEEEKEKELKRLTELIGKPVHLKLSQMMDLTSRCTQLPPLKVSPEAKNDGNVQADQPAKDDRLQVILPGTKWCGAGDLAKNYFDLGEQSSIDKCCRTHDICPVKVLGNSVRYGINNTSPFTKSHCNCDQELRNCLKKENHTLANLMGQLYFNILEVQCVAGDTRSLIVRKQKRF